MTSMLYSAFSAFQTSELFTFSDTLRWVPSLVSLSVKMSRGICDNIKLPNSRRQNTSIFVNRERSDSHLLSYQRLSFFLFFRLQWSFQLKAISRHIFCYVWKAGKLPVWSFHQKQWTHDMTFQGDFQLLLVLSYHPICAGADQEIVWQCFFSGAEFSQMATWKIQSPATLHIPLWICSTA